MKIYDINKAAWGSAVDEGESPYTKTVSPERIAAARQGEWELYLSDCKPVPKSWFLDLKGLKVLCLASEVIMVEKSSACSATRTLRYLRTQDAGGRTGGSFNPFKTLLRGWTVSAHPCRAGGRGNLVRRFAEATGARPVCGGVG